MSNGVTVERLALGAFTALLAVAAFLVKDYKATYDARMIAVEKWQADWPTNGELRQDVIQNSQIKSLQTEADKLADDIEKMKADLSQLNFKVLRLGIIVDSVSKSEGR